MCTVVKPQTRTVEPVERFGSLLRFRIRKRALGPSQNVSLFYTRETPAHPREHTRELLNDHPRGRLTAPLVPLAAAATSLLPHSWLLAPPWLLLR